MATDAHRAAVKLGQGSYQRDSLRDVAVTWTVWAGIAALFVVAVCAGR